MSALLCTAAIMGTTFVMTSSAGAVDNGAGTAPGVTIGSKAPAKAPENENGTGTVHYFSVHSSLQDAGSNYENDGAAAADAVAIGPKAKADGISSVALGPASHAAGAGGISIGRTDLDYRYQGALGDDSIAIGTDAIAGVKDHPEVSASVALGIRAVSNKTDAVALGSYSVADREPVADKTSVYMGSNAAVQNTATNTRSAVAVGRTTGGSSSWSEQFNRQIIGVAAGKEDSDAVNVAQLKAVAKIAESATGSVHYFHVNADDSANPAGTNWNNDGATEARAIAIGRSSKAKGSDSIAIGSESQVETNSGVAIGLKSQSGNSGVAIGANSQSGSESVALGKGAKAYVRGVVALGNGAIATVGNSVAIGSASTADRGTAAPNDVYLNGNANVQATVKGSLGALSVGNNAATRQIVNVAAGKEDGDAVNVAQLKAVDSKVESSATDITALQVGFIVSSEAGTKQDITLGGATKKNIKFEGEANKIDVAVAADGADGTKVTVSANPSLGQNIDINNNSAITNLDNRVTTNAGNITNNTSNIIKLQGGFDLKAGSTTSNVALGGEKPTVEFAAGKNLTVGLTDTKITYGIVEDPEFASVTVKSGTNEIKLNGATGTIAGLSNTTLDSGWGENARAGQAATEGQLKRVKDDIDNLTPTVNNALQNWKVQIDGADVKTVSKTDNILNFKKGDNILLTNDSGAVKIATSLTPHFTEVTVGAAGASKTHLYDGCATFGGISINDAAGSNTVKGLSNITLDTGWGENDRAGQAATEGQLKLVEDKIDQTSTTVNKGLTFKADDTNTVNRKLGETLHVAGDGRNTETRVDGGKVVVALKNELKFDVTGTANKLTINKDDKGTINGLSNTAWNPLSITSGQAATEDQLKAVDDKIAAIST
ncbi:MAG: hypothetical protein SOY64_03670, partial [Pyramidobacter sp.]|nr:hypothetical protein [Pyramidobacter sp.]